MSEMGEKVLLLINEFQLQIYIGIIVCFLILGGTLMFSEDGSEKFKKRAPWMVVGVLFALGATTLGAKYGEALKF